MKIGFVLICYNQKKFIRESLEGIRLQTEEPDEVIISDDCSKDGTQQEILDYIDEFELAEKWKVILHKENQGINKNLQNAIDLCSTDIILGNAGDDISLPNRVQVARKLAEKYPDLYVITTSIDKIDENGNRIGEITYNDILDEDIKKVVLSGMPHIFPVGQFWRKSLFTDYGPLPINVPNEDDQITFRAILHGGIFCSKEKTMLYRIHQNSTSSWLRNRQSEQEFFRRFISDMTIRINHMELWKDSVSKSNFKEKKEVLGILDKKISLYNMFRDIETVPINQRIASLFKFWNFTVTREKVYLFFGSFGVLLWRRMKIALGKI
ncbi:glycosyltransferase [Sphingobacterium siyangense]|uniref:glycosyltransferase n=1 Tax=Sphingobacterium TaxID=28453 RepID=UPI0020109392|nr:glycosyltransferase [Sphingobacterium siyangense]UQA75588.1 glycosyltransferase [Sphingobacterium siyangense]